MTGAFAKHPADREASPEQSVGEGTRRVKRSGGGEVPVTFLLLSLPEPHTGDQIIPADELVIDPRQDMQSDQSH